MNPKFRDLQIQAFAECKTFEDDQLRTDEVFERFAELLIRECAYIPIDMWDKAELNADVAVKIEDRIKQHFGVTE